VGFVLTSTFIDLHLKDKFEDILKGSSEAVTRRRTDNAMVKRKMKKGQTMSYTEN
jgi:hypothetical protein